MQEKRALLNSISVLTELNSRFIADNSFDELNSNLEKRQGLIMQLKDAEEQIKSELKSNKALSLKHKSLSGLIGDTDNILKKIVDSDRESEKALQQKKEEIRDNIKNNNIRKKGFAGYNLINYGVDSFYIDQNR